MQLAKVQRCRGGGGGGIIIFGSYSCFLMRFASVKNDRSPGAISFLETGSVRVLVSKRVLVGILVPGVLDVSGHMLSNVNGRQL